jgi:hypothetical protein
MYYALQNFIKLYKSYIFTLFYIRKKEKFFSLKKII